MYRISTNTFSCLFSIRNQLLEMMTKITSICILNVDVQKFLVFAFRMLLIF